ncbi:potassium/proton antiporter [Solirubrobacter phytolaccae]|uniref:Potassium/proton antiporter n=1 Tax=Solirubrobacter phytolaccae TaxID=1404360 RepID=A0A9X3S7T8_9ACTN|nr:potassium/proton antiporter [Solirubrobacter phytolaccae]MDA0180723.1 potassium/proton antiporter [Solirubrobacter phytolaccae]
MEEVGFLALAVGSLLAAGIAASLLAGRLRLPGLVLVLVLGMVIGTDGVTLIDFHDYEVAQGAAVLALALILYEGGLSSGWAEIRPVIGPSIALATAGTLITAGVTAVAALFLFSELTTLEAFVLGSTVAATDAAAVFAVLRGSTLRRKIARTLEGESGVNDPIAILLVIGGIEAIKHSDYGIEDALWLAGSELAIGAAVGMAVGFLGVFVLRQVTLPSAGLYPVASVAFAALAYGGAAEAHGTGFLAVFIAGLVIGSASSPARRTIITFHEGLAWVAQLALFLLLGLLVNPRELIEFIPEGTAIAIVTAVIARPLAAVLVAYGFSLPERLILGWAGLRGATPIVFATFPVTEGLPHGEDIFKVAFFVVLLSTVLQGLTIEPVARWLGVTSDEAAIPAPLVEPVLLNRLGAETMQFPVRNGDAIEGRPVRELGLPREALLNVIVRGDRAIPPRGSTIIQEHDQLHVLVRQEVAMDFRELMRRWRTGPVGPPERPRRQPRSRPSVTTIRPWSSEEGDPQRPKILAGQNVVEQLRTRRDEPGALVAMEDGRYGVSGPLMAIGPAGELQAFARRRLANASSPAEKAWWQEVVGALAR